MNTKQVLATGCVVLVGGVVTILMLQASPGSNPAPDGHAEHGHAEHGHAGAEQAEGPHGGRLLADGDFAVEVMLFEGGGGANFRVYAFDQQQPVDPQEVTLSIELHRLGGGIDVFDFVAKNDHLAGPQVVEEPHSFDVTVVAIHRGATHRWTYASHEGRTQLTPEAIERSGLVFETAGPATIKSVLMVHGRVVPNEDQLAHVIPRYPGIIKEVRKRLGDAVAKDEVLAVVESNESLQRYEVRAAMAGSVIEKDVALGEFIEGKVIFTVADLSSLWVDFYVPRQARGQLKVGLPVSIDRGYGQPRFATTLTYVSPIGAEDTQTLLARVELRHLAGVWQPGWFVSGEIVVEEATVPLAVKAGALQTWRDWDVVFINEGNLFEARPLQLGRRDRQWVEVVGGLTAGQRYVAENSFLIKADIGKSGTVHDH